VRVLVVEDDLALADLLVRTLLRAHWAADIAGDGRGALAALETNEYDLVVLDLGLPDMDGVDVCRRWRASGGRAPILILTARSALQQRVTGLDAGADDYLPKPFEPDELLARLRALARRDPSPQSPVLRLGDLALDPATHEVRRAGGTIALSPREYALLEYMLRNPHRVVSRTRLIDHVWNDNFDPVANAVEVLVSRVRRKVDTPGVPPLFQTVRGAGYMLTDRRAVHGA
jgi:DNA-binding response OmpR family regulator